MTNKFSCLEGNAEIRQFKGHASNMYLISYPEENRTVLVDCGLPQDIPELLDFIEEKGLPPIEKVVCTHFHVDHVAGWTELKKHYRSIFIFFHKEAIGLVSGKERMSLPYPSDFTKIMLPVMKENHYLPTLKEAMEAAHLGTSFKSHFPMDRVSFFSSVEEIIPGFETIHTPGHRPESVSFYEPESGAFISGDFIIVMNDKVVVNTFVYDSKMQMESVEKVKKLENLIYLMLGHGNCMDFNENTIRYEIKKDWLAEFRP